MTRRLFCFFLFSLFLVGAYGQAKKPTLMVVPSDNFCYERGCMSSFDVQGQTKRYPDYRKALQENDQIRMVITKMGSIMAQRGFPMKDLEQELKNLETESAEIMMLSSKTSGAAIYETPVDKLKRVANADIILDLDFDIKRQGPQKYVTFNLKALDAYTSKQVAGAAGAGQPSTAASVDLLLEEAVLSHMDNFNDQLMDHFQDMFDNGREVTITLLIWENAMFDFYDEYTYEGITEELGFILEDWFAMNTVNGRFSTSDATESRMEFEQVRIPLFYERRGREYAMDARRYVNELRKCLRDEPFMIESKIYQRGLGEAWLILGEK
ncbi:MAG: DUF6175 family protein [Bacteroidales bacterium]|nr:DUF6175 family protein [Bacteroidales bacterium]